MNRLRLHRLFVEDLLGHGDASFPKRVLKHIFDEFSGVSNSMNDHRYHGVPDAWIRYLSRGNTAYRIIYINDGGERIFFRCGNHDVEDEVQPPGDLASVVEIEVVDDEIEEMTGPLTFLSNHRRPLLYGALLRRRLIPNKSVYLISPYIDPTMLYRGSRVGKVLDAICADGADVKVISSAERVWEFERLWKDLEARGIEMVFLERLHAKIYLFVTDHDHYHHLSTTASLGVVGSSNLTKKGISDEMTKGNLETNYSVAESNIAGLEEIAQEYYFQALEFRRAAKVRQRNKTRETVKP